MFPASTRIDGHVDVERGVLLRNALPDLNDVGQFLMEKLLTSASML
jgi:hypothetical protein